MQPKLRCFLFVNESQVSVHASPVWLFITRVSLAVFTQINCETFDAIQVGLLGRNHSCTRSVCLFLYSSWVWQLRVWKQCSAVTLKTAFSTYARIDFSIYARINFGSYARIDFGRYARTTFRQLRESRVQSGHEAELCAALGYYPSSVLRL